MSLPGLNVIVIISTHTHNVLVHYYLVKSILIFLVLHGFGPELPYIFDFCMGLVQSVLIFLIFAWVWSRAS